MNKITLLILAGASYLLSACADGNYTTKRLDASFGQTEKRLVQASIADPQAALNPPAYSTKKFDGYAGFLNVKSYRESFLPGIQQPTGVSINLNSVGGSSGSGSSGR
jgi:hypothetical protein